MPSPLDSYPVNTDKIIFALTEPEKIWQKQSDNTVTVASLKNCLHKVSLWICFFRETDCAHDNNRCTQLFSTVQPTVGAHLACLTSSEQINEASVACGSTDAPLNHKFSSRVHAVGAQCKPIALGRRASYCTLITSVRAQAAARQRKMATLFLFIRGLGATPLQTQSECALQCCALYETITAFYGVSQD